MAEGDFTPLNPGTLESVRGFTIPQSSEELLSRYYEFKITFDRPVIIETHGIYKDIYNDYDSNGHYLGGNDHIYFMDFSTFTPATELNFTQYMRFTPYEPLGNGVTRHWTAFYNGGIYVNADDNQPLHYVMTMTAVPEPATWTMMILGFGLVGSVARHRRERCALSYRLVSRS